MKKVFIFPTGNEIADGIVLDTDSPEIISQLLRVSPDCAIMRSSPLRDAEAEIERALEECENADLAIFIGGSGGGHRHIPTLGEDYTQSALGKILSPCFSREIYGHNGHLWCRLLCGKYKNTLVINLPGPFAEAKAAMEAFCRAVGEDGADMDGINLAMTEAVYECYPRGRAYRRAEIQKGAWKIKNIPTGKTLLVGILASPLAVAKASARTDILKNYKFDFTADPKSVDIQLAEAAGEFAPMGTLAAAVSANAWDMGYISGGVIGTPHTSAESADGGIEEIDDGLWCWARAESPGFVIEGSREKAEQGRDEMLRAIDGGEDLREAFLNWAAGEGIINFLFITDGSGSKGILCAGDKAGRRILTID